MTDPTLDPELTDHLRAALTARAAVPPAPAPRWDDLSARLGTTTRRRRFTALTAASAALVLTLGGGVALGSIITSASAPPPTASPATHQGAALTPGAANAATPSTGGAAAICTTPSSLNHLFTRTTASGVTIRAYTAPTCSPVVSTPPGTPSPLTPDTTPAGTPTTSPITNGVAICPSNTSSLTAELSTTAAVGTGQLYTTPTPSTPISLPPNTTSTPPATDPVSTPLETLPSATEPVTSTTETTPPATSPLATDPTSTPSTTTPPIITPPTTTIPASPQAQTQTGVFGTAEGQPVGWVALTAPTPALSVSATFSSGTTDQMTLVDGYAVLAAPLTAGATSFTATLTFTDASANVVFTQSVNSAAPLPIAVPGATGSGSSAAASGSTASRGTASSGTSPAKPSTSPGSQAIIACPATGSSSTTIAPSTKTP